MADYDLTNKLAQFFDLHLIIPLLEFFEQRKVCLDFIITIFEIL